MTDITPEASLASAEEAFMNADFDSEPDEVEVDDEVQDQVETEEDEAEEEVEVDDEVQEDEVEDRTYTRGEVKKLKNENANLRQRYKTWESAGEGWVPEAQAQWQNLMRLAAYDPIKGAEAMRQSADQLESTYAGEPAPEDGDGDPGTVSMNDVQAMIEDAMYQRDQTTQVQQLQQTFETQIKDLGYEYGSEEATLLLSMVASLPDMDILKANDMLTKVGQRNVDKFVQSKATKQSKAPKTATNGATPLPPEQQLKSFDDADAATFGAF